MKIQPKNGDTTGKQREVVKFYDGSLVGFHALFSD